MADEAGGSEERVIEGFPAVPDVACSRSAGTSQSRAVERCLELLDRPDVRSYGADVMRSAAMAAEDVRKGLRRIGQLEEAAPLKGLADALAGFAPDPGAGRRRRTAVERLKGRAAPIDAVLTELDRLVDKVPDLSGARAPGPDALAATYGRALAATVELDAYVEAGQVMLRAITRRIEATTPPGAAADGEAAGAEGEVFGQKLRKRRDTVERRTHMLRIVRTRIGTFLDAAREAAGVRAALAGELEALETQALPRWQEALLAAIEQSRDVSHRMPPVDLAPVVEANAALRGAVRKVLDAAAGLGASIDAADRAAPPEIEAIEKKLMGVAEGGEA